MEFETRDEEAVQDSFDAIGAELASARLARGVQLAELAQLLRISRQYLKDLESGDHRGLPGPTYVSGYIRSVAREVGLDGEAMSRRYRALLDGKSAKPTYYFPVDSQQPQRSGAMIASIVVIFAVAAYGGWYAVGKPDVTAGVFGSAEQDVAVATPQVEITATEPDNLISRDADTQALASSATAPASAASDADAAPDELAAASPGEDAAPVAAADGTDALLASDNAAPQTDAADTQAPAVLAAAEAPAADGPAAVQPVDEAPQTELAAGTDASSSVAADGPAMAEETSPVAALAAAGDAAGVDDASLNAAGDAQPAVADSGANALSSGGVAFARQRLPELEITVRATGISWVEIIRNDGEEVMTKLMREGEIYVVDSRDKLYLSTGNAGGLELLFHDGSVRSIGANGEILRDLPLDAERLRNQL